MRNVLIIGFMAMLCLISPFGFAKAKVNTTPTTVALYAEPSPHAKVITQIDPRDFFVRIYEKDAWMKIGNPRNGQVGWVSKSDYKAVLENLFKPKVDFTTFTLTAKAMPDAAGKYVVDAYKNGKKLSQKEAQALFNKMQSQSETMQENFTRLQQDMSRSLMRSMKAFADNFQEVFGDDNN